MYRITPSVKFAFLILIYVATSCSGNNRKAPEKIFIGEPSMVEVSIGGMTCTGCEQTIQNNVGKVEGVRSVKASWETGMASVEYFPQMTDTSRIREAVVGSGYSVNGFSPLTQEDAAK
jgi:copper chaperone CopZ